MHATADAAHNKATYIEDKDVLLTLEDILQLERDIKTNQNSLQLNVYCPSQTPVHTYLDILENASFYIRTWILLKTPFS